MLFHNHDKNLHGIDEGEGFCYQPKMIKLLAMLVGVVYLRQKSANPTMRKPIFPPSLIYCR